MTDTFSITPPRLRKSGQELSDLGDALAADRDSLHAVGGGDSVWGNDEAGSSFRGAYLEVVEAASHALRALAGGISDTGAALEATARDTEAIDRAQADDLRRLLGELP